MGVSKAISEPRRGGIMKRIMAMAATVAVAACVAMTGCEGNSTLTTASPENKGRFECERGVAYIVTDTRTDVQYLVWEDVEAGGVCVLVDADGRPMLAHGRAD